MTIVSRKRLRRAAKEGFERGRLDIHATPAVYRTGAEWLAWLEGWRRGQAELARRRRLEIRP